MASPAAETMQNGISTPPATANAPTLSPPTQSQPTSQPQQTNGAPTAAPIDFAIPRTSLQDTGTSKRPRDARLIHLVLSRMGVQSYTERVPLQLLDFAYRYTSGILSDALSYEPPLPTTSGSKKRNAGANAEGGEEGGVSLSALRTAVGARAASTFQGQLGKEFMSDVAQERNRIALPRVEKEFGVRLPPERYCFTGVGWGVKGGWEEEIEVDDDEVMEDDEPSGAGFGGPVGGVSVGINGTGDAAGADTTMGGMDEDEDNDEEFEEAMGIGRENNG